MTDISSSIAHRDVLLSMIEKLPQSRLIPLDRRSDWIERVLMVEPSRAEWHIKRAGGIGGSEIGVLVNGLRGGYDAFSSPRELVKNKLLHSSPDGGNGHTRRGTSMEPIIKDIFGKKFDCISESKSIYDMRMVRDADLPWLTGNPDDVCLIGGKRYIIDYKCPMPDTLDGYKKQDGVNFNYVTQLHHMRMLADRASINIDGMLLVSLDMREWDVDTRLVQYDKSIEDEIVFAGNHFWNEHVMTGILPDPPARPRFDLSLIDEHDRIALTDLALGFVSAKAVESCSSDEASEFRSQISRLTEKYQIDDAKISLPGVGVKAKKVLQKDEVVKLSVRSGLITMDVVSNIDDEALELLVVDLESSGEDVSRCHYESHAPTISRSKKGFDFELVAREKDAANIAVLEFIGASKIRGLPNLSEISVAQKVSKKPKI